MRSAGVGVWVFLHLVMFGMAAYLYLLWVQYWRYADTTRFLPQTKNYSRPVVDSGTVHGIEVRSGHPRFMPRRRPFPSPGLGPFGRRRGGGGGGDDEEPITEAPNRTTTTTTTTTAMPRHKLLKFIEKHKMDLTVHLRTAQMDGGNILFQHENRYGVKFRGRKIRGAPTREQLLCAFRQISASVRSLRDGDEPFTSQGVAKHFPSTELLEGRYFNTCAVVSSSASIKGSKLGTFIDSHDAVVRFNHAPTEGFEEDVGSRTTLRIVNSQVVTKPEFDFWGSPMYSDVALLVWDPCNYTATLEDWYKAPDFDLFPVYFRRRLMLPQEDLHLLHPASLWRVWDVLQKHSFTRILQNPPSSGFLGIVLMMAHCETVNAIEFVPSLRLSKQCHYWSSGTDSGCTFGDWHPLATEKLLSLVMNLASDEEVYSRGYVRIPGFRTITTCPTQAQPYR